MKPIKVYSKDYCPFCVRAKRLLETHGLEFEEINLENDSQSAEQLFARTGFRTVPQIFIGEECIGGYDELAALVQAGELEAKLK